jgi:hypothetical protein
MPLVARYGAEYADPEKYQTARRAVYAPWVLADVARLRLVRGTEFRSKPTTDDDLLSAVRPTSLGFRLALGLADYTNEKSAFELGQSDLSKVLSAPSQRHFPGEE